MVVRLQPLEFADCITDSPYFRENLHAHERELDKTNSQIKRIIKEVKELFSAAKHLSRLQRSLSVSLQNFSFECIGTSQTDDELIITKSLAEFGKLISAIEDERDRMLERALDQIIYPLENFRKDHIGGVKEGRKKFEKQTAKFCQSQERYLNLSTKKQDSVLQEADATLEMEQRHFCQASLEYVFLLQEVQERKKFEFVEILLGFMFGWLTFYHQGHEVAQDFQPYMRELQFRIQKTRENFNATRDKTESLMKKMLELRQMKPTDSLSHNKVYSREGYLYLLEKKALIGTTTWTKHYCMYQRDNKEFTMIPYNQMTGKFTSGETIILSSCVRRMSETIDKRFCFDITTDEKPGVVYTFQALSEEDRKLWMDVMDGKEPTYGIPIANKIVKPEERCLDDAGFNFITKCISVLESRGLEEQGLYRVVGVSSKVIKLISMGLDRRKLDKISLEDAHEWESKTITSGLKTYLRNLHEPLMTFKYHNAFIQAAQLETKSNRINEVHRLLHKLPAQNVNMLDIIMKHLVNVATHSDKNLMTVSNLAVCFGPTLLRPEEETVAAIMDIKFCNVVVEILIENYLKIFKTAPPLDIAEVLPSDSRNCSPQQSARLSAHTPSPTQHLIQSVPIFTHAVVRAYCDGPLLSSSMRNVAASNSSLSSSRNPSETYASVPFVASHSVDRDHFLADNNNVPHTKNYQTSPRSAASLRQVQCLSGPSPAYSESNLHTLLHSPRYNGSPRHYANPSRPPQTTNYYSQVTASLDHLNSSSSNESIASFPSQDLYATGDSSTMPTPQKNKRGSKLSVHYATSYRPYDSVRVRTLYACLGENDGELSFEPNQIITNVRSSLEPGWLRGTLNGKTGLVPENYVEILP